MALPKPAQRSEKKCRNGIAPRAVSSSECLFLRFKKRKSRKVKSLFLRSERPWHSAWWPARGHRAAASEEQAERAAAQPGPAVLQAQVEWEVAALGGEVHLVRHRRI